MFVLFALALTTATHWPELSLGTAESPAPDKLIHLVAFGTMAALLWLTRWVRPLWLFALVTLSWAALDEVSQAWPGLGRHLSWQDLFASQLGVIIVLGWRWALRPVGGPASRRRQQFGALAFESIFAHLPAWVLVPSATLAGLVVAGNLAWVIAGFGNLDAIMLAGLAGGLIAFHVAVEGLRRREAARLAASRPCLRCGRSAREASFDGLGLAPCAGCGATLWVGQWPARLDLPRPVLVALAARPAIISLGVLGGLISVYFLAALLHTRVPLIGGVNRFYASLPADFRLSLDLTIISLVMALAVDLTRQRLADTWDRQHRRCLSCDQAVHASPVRGGAGRCSECGRVFHVPEKAKAES